MEKKEIEHPIWNIIYKSMWVILIFCSFIVLIQMVKADNLIYGDVLPETERLTSISVSSDPFFYNNFSYIYVKAFNANNELIDLTSLTIEPYNFSNYVDYKTTPVSQMLNNQYKKGFSVQNKSIEEITFKITATKGEKVITQDYTVDFSVPSKSSQFKEKFIASANFLYEGFINNWITILVVIIIIFIIVFILKGVGYLMK
jgi:hypothetical protein